MKLGKGLLQNKNHQSREIFKFVGGESPSINETRREGGIPSHKIETISRRKFSNLGGGNPPLSMKLGERGKFLPTK